ARMCGGDAAPRMLHHVALDHARTQMMRAHPSLRENPAKLPANIAHPARHACTTREHSARACPQRPPKSVCTNLAPEVARGRYQQNFGDEHMNTPSRSLCVRTFVAAMLGTVASRGALADPSPAPSEPQEVTVSADRVHVLPTEAVDSVFGFGKNALDTP